MATGYYTQEDIANKEFSDDADAKKVKLVGTTGGDLISGSTECIQVVRGKGGISMTRSTATTSLVNAAAALYWITYTNTSVAGRIGLDDNANTSTTTGIASTKWGVSTEINAAHTFNFDPPMEFGTGIYLTVTTSTGFDVNIAYK